MVGKVRLDIITKSRPAKNAEHFYHIVLASQENDFFYSSHKTSEKTYAVPTCVLCEFFRLFGPTFDTHRLPEKSSFIINKSNVCFSSGSLNLLRIPFFQAQEVHDMIHPKNPRRYQKKNMSLPVHGYSHTSKSEVDRFFDHPRWDV